MKHLFSFFIAIVSICNVWAQNSFEIVPSLQVKQESSYNPAPQVDGEVTITWLNSDNYVTAFGLTNGGTLAAYMEFYPDDLINYNNTGKTPQSITQVQFFIPEESLSGVTNPKVSIRKGATLQTSTEVVSQSVDNLIGGWNYVDLDGLYTIDLTQNLYIGYEVTHTKGNGPLSVTDGSNPKQAWLFFSGSADNLIPSYKYQFLIKAIALSEELLNNEIALQSVNIPEYAAVDENVAVEGVVKNYGKEPLTSFTLNYSINGIPGASSRSFTELNIAPNATFSFTAIEQLTITEPITYTVSLTLSNPNGGAEDRPDDNTLSNTMQGYSEAVSRVVLHESFTSSTCPPCAEGNRAIKTVLDAADATRWVSIRYQMNWPGVGDPYYTLEGGEKRVYYNISAAPWLVVDGNKFNGDTRNYTITKFNELAASPALIALSGSATIVSKTVDAAITITPKTTWNNPDLRLFAAVVEKRTTKNKKNNGETEFLFVMKKFLTNVATGNAIRNLETGVAETYNFSYTFNGNYRLPENSSDLINHATEHSVEDFDNLMIAYWVQNIQTKEILQVGKMDVESSTAINTVNTTELGAYVQDNKLFICSDFPVQNVTIYNISGQKVLSTATGDKVVPVETLPHGVYVVKVKTTQGDKIVKVTK